MFGYVKSIGERKPMLKSRLLIGVLVAAFAISATADFAFAAKKGSKEEATAKHTSHVTASSGGIPVCKKGSTPIWHTMTAKPHWGCVKV